MGAVFVVLTALVQRYHSSWVHTVTLALQALVRFARWCLGKAPLRAEPEKELRTKDNSIIEDMKEFFRQCAIPFVYTWESLGISWLRVVDEWQDFKRWSKDPVDSSTYPQLHQKHALPHYHRALSDQRDQGPVNDTIDAKMYSTPLISSLGDQDEHIDLPARDPTPHTISRWHPNPLPQDADAGEISPIVEEPVSDPHPLKIEQPHLAESSVPPVPSRSLERRSIDGMPRRREEMPRRRSDNLIRPGGSPGPSTS